MATGIAIKSHSTPSAQTRSLHMLGAGLDVLPGLPRRIPHGPHTRTPTSQLLSALLDDVAPDRANMTWLLDGLRQRSFGAIMLVLGFIAMFPGASALAGTALVVFGFQMMMAREVPGLPGFIALRPLPANRLASLIRRAIPVVTILEKFVRPRLLMPAQAMQRSAGLAILLLAMTLFLPVPLSNVLPGALTMMVALAYLEDDGALLGVALCLSLGSIAVTVAEGWVLFKGAGILLAL